MIICEQCEIKYPDVMYRRDRRVYQLPAAKGKVRVCRICTWKNTANNNRVVRYNFDTNKFDIVTLTFKQRLKELFSK
jgi:hypothetical protein